MLAAQAFNRVRDRVRIPLYGCDCYAYGLLAAGHVDLVVEADLKPYDYMALVPIIQVIGWWAVEATGGMQLGGEGLAQSPKPIWQS
jgi:fructose-1,6-bisphosphatase/inositol monophosphatase family enzyme